MFPGIFLCSFSSDGKRSHVTPNSQSSILRSSPSPEYQRPIFSHVKKKQKGSGVVLDDIEADDGYNSSNYSLHFDRDPSRFSLRSYNLHCRNREDVKATNKKRDMSTKASNFSDLIQRVAASCLLHPLAGVKHDQSVNDGSGSEEEDVFRYETEDEEEETEEEETDEEEVEELERKKSGEIRAWKQGRKKNQQQSESNMVPLDRVMEVEMLVNEVFDCVSAMKRAYVTLQEAHCPWDPDQMRVADVAVVGELRNLGVLRERFRRCVIVGDGGRRRKSGYGVGMLREAVAPYEAAVDELKKEVKTKEAEVQNLKEKLKAATCTGKGGKKKGFSSQSKRKVSCSHGSQAVAMSPAPELFEGTMSQVKETSKAFTSILLSLMRAAHWDIPAAVRSIEAAAAANTDGNVTTINAIASTAATHHAKYALESYISRKIFQGFDHETFYMDGSLSSLLNPDQFRRDCFAQYRDMKAMDPVELLGILPTCHFGKFCTKKYLAIVHPKMEESLFGNLEQRQQVVAGNHPRSQFYADFLGLAKAIWLLHLLAFSLDPAPSQFEASRGAEFHALYMESVVKFSGGRVPAGQVVGFPVGPGFKLGNGSIVKARVYLVPRT
ncbi:Protein GRAVITROPIC IN THE LIGHT 1 [Linum perenne]